MVGFPGYVFSKTHGFMKKGKAFLSASEFLQDNSFIASSPWGSIFRETDKHANDPCQAGKHVKRRCDSEKAGRTFRAIDNRTIKEARIQYDFYLVSVAPSEAFLPDKWGRKQRWLGNTIFWRFGAM